MSAYHAAAEGVTPRPINADPNDAPPGRPLLRYQRHAVRYARTYYDALEAAMTALAALQARTPSWADITADSEVPLAERDVVWAMICRTSEDIAKARAELRERYTQMADVARAVQRIPTEWSAWDTKRWSDRPDLFHMTSEDVEDVMTERENGGPFAKPPALD